MTMSQSGETEDPHFPTVLCHHESKLYGLSSSKHILYLLILLLESRWQDQATEKILKLPFRIYTSVLWRILQDFYKISWVRLSLKTSTLNKIRHFKCDIWIKTLNWIIQIFDIAYCYIAKLSFSYFYKQPINSCSKNSNFILRYVDIGILSLISILTHFLFI